MCLTKSIFVLTFNFSSKSCIGVLSKSRDATNSELAAITEGGFIAKVRSVKIKKQRN